ncbi:MAG TPA: gamma-glutamyltransferase, partial [Planctomycetota bacterium]|nr:gamma-glutamyltransferase [Planctomycetota bacterium]
MVRTSALQIPVLALMLLAFLGPLSSTGTGQILPGFDRPVKTRSTRSPVLAKRGMVCASQPLAAEAGIALLRRGGNAFDAAVGAAAVLNVVEPMSTGIGGDMFALAWPAREGKLVGLNGSGRSASTATIERFRAKGHSRVPVHGADSVTVPGAFHGWVTLHSKYGKLPLDVVLSDAIRHAEEGFPVSEVIAADWRAALEHKGVPEFAAAYLVADGDSLRPPRHGEVFRQPDLARTFKALATGG